MCWEGQKGFSSSHVVWGRFEDTGFGSGWMLSGGELILIQKAGETERD